MLRLGRTCCYKSRPADLASAHTSWLPGFARHLSQPTKTPCVAAARAQDTYGPPLAKRLVLFADDLNMPCVDAYGTQQPVALLRQVVERRGMYDRGKDLCWKNLKDVQASREGGRICRQAKPQGAKEGQQEAHACVLAGSLDSCLGRLALCCEAPDPALAPYAPLCPSDRSSARWARPAARATPSTPAS